MISNSIDHAQMFRTGIMQPKMEQMAHARLIQGCKLLIKFMR